MDDAITIDTLALHPRDRHDDRALTAHCADLSAAARAPGDWPEPHERVIPADEDSPLEAPECYGHESLNGPIGSTTYCDGSCRAFLRARART